MEYTYQSLEGNLFYVCIYEIYVMYNIDILRNMY